MKARQIMSKILPASWVPYLLHLRPRSWAIVTAHMTVGFLLANGLHLASDTARRWVIAAITWAVLGNGGTLAINSVFDKDEGDIGYLESPPPPPRHLFAFSLLFLLLGLPVSATLGKPFLIAYVLCMVMSLLYSVPPFRFKARAGLDVLINSAGYGALTIYAGWAATGRGLEPPIINVAAGFFFLFAAFYPLTQIYQMDEDASRNDYTLALALGKRNALILAIVATLVAFAFMLGEAITRYWQLRAAGLVISLLLWVMMLIPWYRNRDRVSQAYEQRGFYRALWVWAITDLSIVLAMVPN